MSIEAINPQAIKKSAKTKGMIYGSGNSNFGAAMDMLGAAENVTATTMYHYGPKNATGPTVLAAAFSGVNSYNSMSGGSIPSYAYGGMGAQTVGGTMPIDASSSVVPGTDGYTQMDMINQMNQNNLQLLSLQATMQSQMQGINTRSNILSAHHRANMAVIEKFTGR